MPHEKLPASWQPISYCQFLLLFYFFSKGLEMCIFHYNDDIAGLTFLYIRTFPGIVIVIKGTHIHLGRTNFRRGRGLVGAQTKQPDKERDKKFHKHRFRLLEQPEC
ncbi:MAG: hypothetical protein D6730_13840 [Bacteroidetes bacterium]|nr:MAG: hypothetical protein D6730_13840 [Bacteroidota bacterium]